MTEVGRPSWESSGLCDGCRHLGHCRLGLRKWIAGETGHGSVTFGPEFAGGPGILHGGWIAAAFDEVLAVVAEARADQLVVTESLTVSFRKPVPISRQLLIEARVVKHAGRRFEATGEMTLGGSDRILATATAAFVKIAADHFQRHADSLTWQNPLTEGATTDG